MTCEAYISPNVEWSLEPSTWFGQTLLTGTVLFILTQMVSKSIAWTVTIWLYNIITFVFFHAILGDPFNPEYSGLTFWEQLMIQLKGSSGMSFFTLFPVVLFLCGARFAKFSNFLFIVNFISLVLVVAPKMLVYMVYYRKTKNEKKKRENVHKRKKSKSEKK
ncbi:hypothetical protein NEPAR06_2059 [Nematocida parisii]|uniref:Uncharacterized protein n=1 Tax=Nematocida parisii (strain ERTm3) TaxID=935791 RepID=I3EDJ9_NEMP3|nr:uncharacterized protein NEPG_01512 [Nematocida parisii ERTm1]EIJ87296.1 hypothetical protein NEQG_02419 [Nematocida parisii ERTm3]KAI5129568.1 hypothetical protein NEPAR03_1731 [Nematocida parisii]KAI5167734.1 hypothetical protein NEIRO02_2217 [Nematocida sp. AWRm79]KAI5185992.1 hypothetical protein NEIRO03_2167 [Nematocida sp. AWRm78]OAG33679.1 hypothetical protein NEIG_02087 [Nematocida sp. ERTm5]|eukprot:XP_013059340.1 hypothetical protein NEPG_01512 [Nematocida parisii ERTm1]